MGGSRVTPGPGAPAVDTQVLQGLSAYKHKDNLSTAQEIYWVSHVMRANIWRQGEERNCQEVDGLIWVWSDQALDGQFVPVPEGQILDSCVLKQIWR